MWKGMTGSLGPCGGGGIAGMVVRSEWRFVDGEGVQGGGDDVVGLPLQDDVALRAEVLW